MKFGTLVRLKNVDDCVAAFEKVKAMDLESCQLVYKPATYTLESAKIIKAAAEKCSIEISAFFAGFYDDYTAWELKYDFRNAGLNSVAFGAERFICPCPVKDHIVGLFRARSTAEYRKV